MDGKDPDPELNANEYVKNESSGFQKHLKRYDRQGLQVK